MQIFSWQITFHDCAAIAIQLLMSGNAHSPTLGKKSLLLQLYKQSAYQLSEVAGFQRL